NFEPILVRIHTTGALGGCGYLPWYPRPGGRVKKDRDLVRPLYQDMSMSIPPGSVDALKKALKACGSETQRLIQPLLPIPAVQHMLLVFLKDTSRPFEEWMRDPQCEHRLTQLREHHLTAEEMEDFNAMYQEQVAVSSYRRLQEGTPSQGTEPPGSDDGRETVETGRTGKTIGKMDTGGDRGDSDANSAADTSVPGAKAAIDEAGTEPLGKGATLAGYSGVGTRKASGGAFEAMYNGGAVAGELGGGDSGDGESRGIVQ
ncbi:unnamed protein product, partial [Discosporangium mesarthrocarpum]